MSFCVSRVVFRELLTSPICAHKGRSLIVAECSRYYATHRDSPTYVPPSVSSSSLLSQALDQKQRRSGREDSVGPFQLGLSQPSFGEGTPKKWSELSPKSKGQSLNFVIIVMSFPRVLQYHRSYASDGSYDEPNGHPVWCWPDDGPHLRVDVGAVLKKLSVRTL
jgi:hypothetical protein